MTAKSPRRAAGKRPNIVVMLADDLGYGDLGCFGGTRIRTPHLDRMAREGARLTNFFSSANVCTPSRAGLLTGRYPVRTGLGYEVIRQQDDRGLPLSEVTIAKALAPAYVSGLFGKWHLGHLGQYWPPTKHGFDTFFGIPYSHDMAPLSLFEAHTGSDEVAKSAVDFNRLQQDFYDHAERFIQANKHRPFFMFLAHWGVHTPLQASKEDYDALPQIKDHRRRVYAAMVRSVDRSVGRVLQAVKDAGLDDNTIVVFTSDNGAPGYIGIPDVNSPYRGWKLTMFQGGLRVPYMAKWPGHIPAGTQYKSPITNIDMLPTLVAAGGGQLPQDRVIDGVNLLPYLAAGAPAQPARPLFWRDGPYRATQDQGWKLIEAQRPDKRWLFNLAADPTEKTNLAATEPQQLARLTALSRAHHAAMPAPLWLSFIEMPVFID